MTGFYHTIMNFLSLVLIFIERSRYYIQKHGRNRFQPCPNFNPPEPEGPKNPWDKFNPVKIADKIAQDVGKHTSTVRSVSI